MKKLKAFAAAAVAATLFAALSASAGTGFYYTPETPNLVVSSAGGPTNQVVLATNLVWPSYIAASTSVTNVTPFAVTGPYTAIEFDVALASNNGAAATNVIAQLGRSVRTMRQQPSSTVTNALGTGQIIEWFATITNTVPASTVAGTVVSANVTFGPNTGQTTAAGDGGITTYYVGYIQAPGIIVTNYSIWVNTTQ